RWALERGMRHAIRWNSDNPKPKPRLAVEIEGHTPMAHGNEYEAPDPWLRRFAAFVCVATLSLIFLGGQVKSHEAGLSVPDWPLTYGQNPITYPISEWRGGIQHEHFHRLYAGGVALLTVVLAGWLHWRDPRP